jgi:hypothetical protein
MSSDFWAEPVNAITNAAFLITAVLSWKLARHLRKLTPGIQLLTILLAAIGVGSFLFHTFATPITRILDIVPILLLTATYIWLYARQVAGLEAVHSGILLAVFLVSAYVGRQFAHVLNGSLIYAPALIFLSAFGLFHYAMRKVRQYDLLIATAIFVVSLCFRTIDNAVCPIFPLGTHFLWHLLNAVALYCAIQGLLLNSPAFPNVPKMGKIQSG